MASLPPTSKTTVTTQESWPATPVQRFFDEDYRQKMEVGDMDAGTNCYALNIRFENTNGVVYNGRDEIHKWLIPLFAPFEKLRHGFYHAVEISDYPQPGKTLLQIRGDRAVWVKGNTSDSPDVEGPLFFSIVVGPAEDRDQTGLEFQMEAIWFFWDTGPLMKVIAKDSVAFSTHNVIRNEVAPPVSPSLSLPPPASDKKLCLSLNQRANRSYPAYYNSYAQDYRSYRHIHGPTNGNRKRSSYSYSHSIFSSNKRRCIQPLRRVKVQSLRPERFQSR